MRQVKLGKLAGRIMKRLIRSKPKCFSGRCHGFDMDECGVKHYLCVPWSNKTFWVISADGRFRVQELQQAYNDGTIWGKEHHLKLRAFDEPIRQGVNVQEV